MPSGVVHASMLKPNTSIGRFAVAPVACPKGQCIINSYVNPAIKTLAALVGIGVTISIIVGGIQYSSAGGDPSKVAAAKRRIMKAIVALVAFIFLYAFLNFIIPGGI